MWSELSANQRFGIMFHTKGEFKPLKRDENIQYNRNVIGIFLFLSELSKIVFFYQASQVHSKIASNMIPIDMFLKSYITK